MGIVWTADSGGVTWRLELERSTLIPGRLVSGTLSLAAHRGIGARALVVALRAEEHWKHRETSTDAEGRTTSHVETTRRELLVEPVQLEGELHLRDGDSREWSFELPVPPAAPPSLEADVAGVTWTVEAKLDIPGDRDSSIEANVVVVQPVGMLRAGAVDVGQFALFDAADASADGVTASISLDPVPLCCGAPFSGRLTLLTPTRRELQEIRGEVRVHVESTVANGLDETVTAWSDVLDQRVTLEGEREIAFSGTLSPVPLPSVELPHGRASATFHIILATAWAPDPHLVRDVAIATTLEI
jgi:hypothetical protein